MSSFFQKPDNNNPPKLPNLLEYVPTYSSFLTQNLTFNQISDNKNAHTITQLDELVEKTTLLNDSWLDNGVRGLTLTHIANIITITTNLSINSGIYCIHDPTTVSNFTG